MKQGHYYKFNFMGYEYIGEYMGREKHFECMVCEKGSNAYCFNVFRNFKDYTENAEYETFSFGKEHMPELTEVQESELN
jgi:hypothetical protein